MSLFNIKFPPLKNLKAILIDFDGTIANSMDLLYEGYRGFMSAFGLEGTRDEFETLTGPSVLEIVGKLKKKYHLQESEEVLYSDYIHQVQKRYITETKIFPGVYEFLVFAKKQGYRLAIVSSSQRPEILAILKRNGLLDFFEKIISAEDVILSKPHPEIYLKALREFAIEADEAVAIEDSLNGSKAALGAGIATLLIHALHFTNAPQCHSWQEVMQFFTGGGLRFLIKKPPLAMTLHSSFTRHISKELEEKVDELWQSRTNKDLFNGKILSVNGFLRGELQASLIEYKYFYAQLADPELKDFFNIKPLAITALTHFEGEILVGRRSQIVTQYPHYYELIPSGSAYNEHLSKLALEELKEETGIEAREISSMDKKYLIDDVNENVFEMFFEIALSEKKELKVSSEHVELKWIKKDLLVNELQKNSYLPISKFILEHHA